MKLVLLLVVKWLRQTLPKSSAVYADLENNICLPIRDLFNNCRPDIAIHDNKSITPLELTICHESNLSFSKLYKQSRYANIADSMLDDLCTIP